MYLQNSQLQSDQTDESIQAVLKRTKSIAVSSEIKTAEQQTVDSRWRDGTGSPAEEAEQLNSQYKSLLQEETSRCQNESEKKKNGRKL